MKKILFLALLGGLVYAGYLFYLQTRATPPDSPLTTGINLLQSPDRFAHLSSVLGETTSRLWQSGLTGLNGLTDGAAEPVINQAVSDLQARIKSLPEEQYQKVKYEFCKDLIEESE